MAKIRSDLNLARSEALEDTIFSDIARHILGRVLFVHYLTDLSTFFVVYGYHYTNVYRKAWSSKLDPILYKRSVFTPCKHSQLQDLYADFSSSAQTVIHLRYLQGFWDFLNANSESS